MDTENNDDDNETDDITIKNSEKFNNYNDDDKS